MTIKIIGMVIVAYLLGAIPSGLWIGQTFYHKDIRKLGSGNIGTTNTFRELGPKAGVVVLLMDVLKGTLAASQPYLLGVSHSVNPLLIGIFSFFLHTFQFLTIFMAVKQWQLVQGFYWLTIRHYLPLPVQSLSPLCY